MVTKFCTPPAGCYTGKMFANVSKIITNWFLTLQPDINYLQFSKVGTRKGMDVI